MHLSLASRYGDEHKLAGFSATLQAIISFVENGYVELSRIDFTLLNCTFKRRPNRNLSYCASPGYHQLHMVNTLPQPIRTISLTYDFIVLQGRPYQIG